MMRCAAALLKAGGLGVKVESAGVAHAPQAWLDYVETFHLFSSFDALVVYVTGEQAYSCGMHNLGLPDAITDGVGHAGAADLLRTFNRHQFVESPELFDDQTFAEDAEATVYRLRQEPSVDYGEDSPYNNPYGCWRLTSLATRQ